VLVLFISLIRSAPTCKENDLKAGMGMVATIKNANMLLKAAKNMLTPALARR